MASLIAEVEGERVDIGRELSWLYPEMTARRRLFCFYEAVKAIDGKASSAECARKAGFARKSPQAANRQAAELLTVKKVIQEIANLKSQVKKILLNIDIEAAFYKVVGELIRRTHFDATSLYQDEIVDTPAGEVHTIRAKPLEDLTDEQKAMIEAVEIRGGIANYKVQSKSEAGKEIIELWSRLHADNAAGGYDIEATAAAVGATVRVSARSQGSFEYQRAAAPSYED